MEAWVSPQESRRFGAIITKATPTYFGYALESGGFSSGIPETLISPEATEEIGVKGAEEVPLHTWSYLTATFDGESLRLFVNGTLVETVASSGPQGGKEPLQIGGTEVFNDYFDGHIDEVRVYSRALSVEEITEDMATPVKAIPSSKPPVAAYSLDEGEGEVAHDSSGNGHEATIHGAEWAGGKYGTALRFDASKHDYLSIPDSPELQLSDGFTLEAWVRPASARATPILAKETAESFSYMLDAGGESSGKPEGFVLDESSTASVADSEEIPPRAWSYLTLTSDGEDLRLYVNGKLVATAAAKSAQSSEGDLEIGGDQVFGDYFDGLIDEVRVYSRALSAKKSPKTSRRRLKRRLRSHPSPPTLSTRAKEK